MNGIRESFLILDLFSLKFGNILWPFYGGRSPTVDPSLTGISFRASRIHADIWLSSRLGVLDFMWFTMESELSRTHVRVRAAHQ